MKVVQLPSNIMEATKDIDPSLEEVHSMPIPDHRNLPLIFHTTELEVTKAEAPNIIEPITLILSPKDINIFIIVSHHSTAHPWTSNT